MPPAYPHKELTREDAADRIVFFQKLRTEFIRSLPFALSSDAFTVWGRLNNTDHNAKVSGNGFSCFPWFFSDFFF